MAACSRQFLSDRSALVSEVRRPSCTLAIAPDAPDPGLRYSDRDAGPASLFHCAGGGGIPPFTRPRRKPSGRPCRLLRFGDPPFVGPKQVYYPQSKRWGSSIIWDKTRLTTITDQEIIDAARTLSPPSSQQLLLVLSHRLNAGMVRDNQIQVLATFDGAVAPRRELPPVPASVTITTSFM